MLRARSKRNIVIMLIFLRQMLYLFVVCNICSPQLQLKKKKGKDIAHASSNITIMWKLIHNKFHPNHIVIKPSKLSTSM